MTKSTKKSQKTFTKVREKEFESIKLMQQAGLKTSQVAKILKRSNLTIARIFKSETLPEYREIVNESLAKAKQRAESPVEVPAEEPLAAVETIFEVIQQAKAEGGIIMTTHAAFSGFEDVYEFVKQASDNNVTVTFAPMGNK